MYRTVVTICTAQWSLYVPHSGHYIFRTAVTICTAQLSPYVRHSCHYMYRTVVTICTTSLTLSNSTFCPHSCIYVFCVDLRTNSDYFPIQHWLSGFYNWDGVCLLRGTDWIFKYNSDPLLHMSSVQIKHATFFMSQRCTLFPDYLYQKDERALPWNLESSTIFCHSHFNNIKCSTVTTSELQFIFYLFLSLSLSHSLSFSIHEAQF